jgi:hypothetical protein
LIFGVLGARGGELENFNEILSRQLAYFSGKFQLKEGAEDF